LKSVNLLELRRKIRKLVRDGDFWSNFVSIYFGRIFDNYFLDQKIGPVLKFFSRTPNICACTCTYPVVFLLPIIYIKKVFSAVNEDDAVMQTKKVNASTIQ
jgi:hypothetical protein